MKSGLLTKEIFDAAWALVQPLIQQDMEENSGGKSYGLKVFVKVVGGKEFLDSRVVGERAEEFHLIGASKTNMSARTGKSTFDIAPAERLTGETKYSGSAVDGGIAVGASGGTEEQDGMYAGWYLHAILALVRSKYKRVMDSDEDFIS